MELLTAWLFLSFVIERFVEVVTKLLPVLKNVQLKEVNVQMLIALLASGVLAFGAQLDFFKMFNVEFQWPYVGEALSALFMAAGSNVVHDIVVWLSATKNKAKY